MQSPAGTNPNTTHTPLSTLYPNQAGYSKAHFCAFQLAKTNFHTSQLHKSGLVFVPIKYTQPTIAGSNNEWQHHNTYTIIHFVCPNQ